MENVLTKLKIKSGSVGRVKSFLQELNLQSSEMTQLLRECKILLDCSFVVEEESIAYLYIFKVIPDHNYLSQSLDASVMPLAKKIQDWAEECFESRTDWVACASFTTIPELKV